ncbi:MAG: hypothetical protein EOO03_08655 [Chitinophagaceae bacterium]|nr:MAG: hypothetical protein EOO03_08655 [Chitinophagaceae bacterium]
MSFNDFAIKKTGGNSALSYLLKNAITGVYPDFSIDFSKVLVCRGDIPNATAPTAAVEPGSILRFNWVDNTGVGVAKASDLAILVAHCPELQQSVYNDNAAPRAALTDNLNLLAFSGKLVHTYIAFRSEDGRGVSPSFYLGEHTVS